MKWLLLLGALAMAAHSSGKPAAISCHDFTMMSVELAGANLVCGTDISSLMNSNKLVAIKEVCGDGAVCGFEGEEKTAEKCKDDPAVTIPQTQIDSWEKEGIEAFSRETSTASDRAAVCAKAKEVVAKAEQLQGVQ
jgi:hypothetical protein